VPGFRAAFASTKELSPSGLRRASPSRRRYAPDGGWVLGGFTEAGMRRRTRPTSGTATGGARTTGREGTRSRRKFLKMRGHIAQLQVEAVLDLAGNICGDIC
jgi:hypothetical protein